MIVAAGFITGVIVLLGQAADDLAVSGHIVWSPHANALPAVRILIYAVCWALGMCIYALGRLGARNDF